MTISLGPITATLEEELKHELRQHGIAVWLDKDAVYNGYVDQLVKRYEQGQFPFPVIAFRGSYLKMLLALEPYGNGELPDRLLIHMPGHTEESIRKTPLLELYHSGKRFRKALNTLIRQTASGRVNPDQIEAYLNTGIPDLSAADQWLETACNQPKGDLSQYLESLNLEWVLDSLVTVDPNFKGIFSDASSLSILSDYLYRKTGMDGAFQTFYRHPSALSFIDLSETFAAWLMSIEYVHDLARSPYLDALKPLKQLSTPLKQTCDRLIDHLRERHPEAYENLARQVEGFLEEELKDVLPEDLGKIDTFLSEENAILKGAMQALRTEEWDRALDWAQDRLENPSFWISRDRKRRIEWVLVRDAAILGLTLVEHAHPLKGSDRLSSALDAYTNTGFEVDRAHRKFEQQRSKLLSSDLTHFGLLLEISDQLRHRYREWADTLAQEFAKICESDGFLPEDTLQQRSLYEQVVHPLTQTEAKTAYFLIDAFRYEMATELIAAFEGPGTSVTLKARYAELPTITAVGMNVLAPLSKAGKLTLGGDKGFGGFKTGEYTVKKPDERVRAMGDRSVDNVNSGRRRVRQLKLSEVCDRSTDSLKQGCVNADLIVVHSKEIDDAGEANLGLIAFEECLKQLTSAWNRLKSIGINEFVFTADHGFLLQDQTTQQASWGTIRSPQRRYVLDEHLRSEPETVTVSLSALNYEGQTGYLLFRRDTAVFATGNPGATFVHGGNSLQERVIPVLSVSHRNQPNLKIVKYCVEVQAQTDIAGFSRLKVRVKPAPVAQGVLSFTGAKTITLGLRVPERPDIQVNIKDVPNVVIQNQQIPVALDADWIEVVFDLSGYQDERVRIEVYHPDASEDVESATLETYFKVAGTLRRPQDAPILTQDSVDWQDGFEDPAVAQVFVHLQKHGSITESELAVILGNPRKVRRFAVAFDEYLLKVPFPVRIEATSSGKRYVKQT
jgi:PglZ domain